MSHTGILTLSSFPSKSPNREMKRLAGPQPLILQCERNRTAGKEFGTGRVGSNINLYPGNHI